MNKYKKLTIYLLFMGIVSILVGVTYSFFNYTKTGLANNFRVGTVSFVTSQNGSISLTNVFPITSEELDEDVGNHDSVTISITGSTTYSDGVEYLVTFDQVNDMVNDKIVPIAFEVESTGIGTSSNDYYNDRGSTSSVYLLTDEGHVQPDKYIVVGYIASGQNGINGSITITAYVDADRMAISDTYYNNGDTSDEWVDGRTVFTTSEWSSLKGANALSFKVKVEANEGIWVNEEATPDSCFSVVLSNEKIYEYNNDRTNANIASCVSYLTSEWGEEEYNTIHPGETYEAFCAGTGTNRDETFQDKLDSYYFTDSELNQLEEIGVIKGEFGASILDYDASCGSDVIIPNSFDFEVISSKSYNENRTTESINSCVSFLTSLGYDNMLEDGESISAFCAGTGTVGGSTIQESLTYLNNNILLQLESFNIVTIQRTTLHSKTISIYGNMNEFDPTGAFLGKELTSVIIPNTVSRIYANAFNSNKLKSIVIPDSVRMIGQSAFNNNNISSLTLGKNIKNLVQDISNRKFNGMDITSFEWTKIRYIDKEIINNGLFYLRYYGLEQDRCLRGNLTLGNSVKDIGDNAFYNNELTSVTIPNGVTSIGNGAFQDNELTSITIPNSVTTIGANVFHGNQLTSVTIGNGINSINYTAFGKNAYSNPNLTSITIDKTCSIIKNNIKGPFNTNYYPWLASNSPYTASGVTIYGSNNEVCDAY